MIASGLFIKIVLADDLGSQVDPAFSRPFESLGAADVWLMAVAFGLQIYFDFSSYTRMAIGSASSWGSSLSTISTIPTPPVAGRVLESLAHVAVAVDSRLFVLSAIGHEGDIVGDVPRGLDRMALCGVWHGAGWTFMVWGLYHGRLICGFHVPTFDAKPRVRPPSKPVSIGS